MALDIKTIGKTIGHASVDYIGFAGLAAGAVKAGRYFLAPGSGTLFGLATGGVYKTLELVDKTVRHLLKKDDGKGNVVDHYSGWANHEGALVLRAAAAVGIVYALSKKVTQLENGISTQKDLLVTAGLTFVGIASYHLARKYLFPRIPVVKDYAPVSN